MKNRQNNSRSAKRHRRLPILVVICAIAFLALGAVTVISRQKSAARSTSSSNTKFAPEPKPAGKILTVKVAGQDVQVDPNTGQIKPLTAQEKQQLADGLKKMLNRSTDDLVEVHHPDGSVSMELKDHFQNVAVARVNEDGTVSRSCVDNPESAAAFFGIDPELVGGKRTSTQPTPVRSPAKN
jgi:cell division protein FtsN